MKASVYSPCDHKAENSPRNPTLKRPSKDLQIIILRERKNERKKKRKRKKKTTATLSCRKYFQKLSFFQKALALGSHLL